MFVIGCYVVESTKTIWIGLPGKQEGQYQELNSSGASIPKKQNQSAFYV